MNPAQPAFNSAPATPDPPERTLVVDFLPDRPLQKVENLTNVFLGGFVFDKWTCNCDGRQAIFFRSADHPGGAYSGLLIDHGFCFNGGEWNFRTLASRPVEPSAGRLPDRVVKSPRPDRPNLNSAHRFARKRRTEGCPACSPEGQN